MNLLDRLTAVFGRGDADATPEYHCRECDGAFEADGTEPTALDCPHCGASGSRAVERL